MTKSRIRVDDPRTYPSTGGGLRASAAVKSLVGLDSQGYYLAAIDYLARMKFPANEISFAHVETPEYVPVSYYPPVIAWGASADFSAERERQTRELFARGRTALRNAGIESSPNEILAAGSASAEMIAIADRIDADLVAIGSRRSGPLESFVLGSVGRALAIGSEHSFLIARGHPRGNHALRAVFATDHSDYADRCFDRLIAMAPKGISHLSIVTASDEIGVRPYKNPGEAPDPSIYALTRIERDLRENGCRMMDRLEAIGIHSDFRLLPGHPEEMIRRAMADARADLLILGARGHGLVERLLVGSLTLHAVVSEPYSVLVLRAPEESNGKRDSTIGIA